MIELINIKGYSLTLLNVILIVITWAIILFLRSKSDKKIEEFLKKHNWSFGKEKTLHKLSNQLLFIIGDLLTIGILGIGNKDFSLSSILDYQLLGGGDESKFSITIGSIIFIIILSFITKFVLNLTKTFIYKSTKDKDWIDEGRRFTITRLTSYFIYVIVAIMMLRSINVDITLLLTASMGIFLGVGLGLQEFLTDVISGLILLFDGSVKVGDIVEMDNTVAKVQKINIRTSHIKTIDGKTIIVPNSKLTEFNVTNWTISEKVTRFNIEVTVAYGTDTALVKDLLYQCALQHPKVSKNKEILIIFNDFGDNGLSFELYFWAAQTWDIMTIKSDIRFAIDAAFRANSIQIPYPQRDLHIISDNRVSI
ncbi:MAG: mechanosensitive ion channel [Flavobacteriales bacterium]|jgi:small-conductance mechanosensitive channel|nr:mechanosensitive ion channel [Flavobacteriales bacterium]